jgi:hypothetical protein
MLSRAETPQEQGPRAVSARFPSLPISAPRPENPTNKRASMSNKRVSEASWEQSNKRVRTTSDLDIAPLGTARETDPRKLEQRQKQIGYGKNSLAYQRYLEEVPLHKRRFDLINSDHPRTPDIARDVSKRTFDGQVKAWRRQLHLWDPPEAVGAPVPAPSAAAPGADLGSEPVAAPSSSAFGDFLGIGEDEDEDVAMPPHSQEDRTPAAAAAAADPRTERSRDGGLFHSGLLEQEDDLPEYYYEGGDASSSSSKPRPAPSAEERRAPAAAAAAHEPLRSRLDAFKAKSLPAAPLIAERSIYDAYEGDAR